jgi:site-specific recombinase XerD
MARFSKQRNGWRLWFAHKQNERSSFCFPAGALKSKASRTRILSIVDELERCYLYGEPLTSTLQTQLDELGLEGLRDKLEEQGLLSARRFAVLGEFCDSYLKKMDLEWSVHRRRNMRYCRDHLVEFFGHEKYMHTISVGEAEDYRREQLAQRSAQTVAKEIKDCRQFFGNAEKYGIVSRNVFKDISAGSMKNDEKFFYVPEEFIEKCKEHASSAEWRLLIAMWRNGGMRYSEPLLAKWEDVDWETDRFTVRSPKTAKQGKPTRQIPLCWIRKELDEMWEVTPDKSQYVLPTLRKVTNLRTTFQKIIKRAGLVPWPRLIQNLRVSKQNDLESCLRMTAVTAFIGNSEAIAKSHYLHATDGDFEIATKRHNQSQQLSADGVQHGAATGCNADLPTNKKSHIPLVAAPCTLTDVAAVPPRGVEPLSLD